MLFSDINQNFNQFEAVSLSMELSLLYSFKEFVIFAQNIMTWTIISMILSLLVEES